MADASTRIVASSIAKLSLLPADLAELEPAPGIGLVVPFDFALDAECWRWMPADAPLFVTRTPSVKNPAVTVELAKKVADTTKLARAVETFSAVKPACVAYGCTSGSFVGGRAGEHKLRETMMAHGAAKAVTSSGALLSALEHLGIKRLAIATPYNASLTGLLQTYLEEAHVEVVSSHYLDRESGIARVSYEAVRYLASVVDRPEAEAIFFSCTNLRTFDILEELELILGKPVLSGNQVMMWAALSMADLELPQLNQSLFPSHEPIIATTRFRTPVNGRPTPGSPGA